ncbi:MAG: DMT family transporter [Asgard group archaeon]|nr:DMT family transporter [Asgard group archaeon]
MENVEVEHVENDEHKQPSTQIIDEKIAKEKFTWQVALMLAIIVLAWSTPNVIGRYLQQNSEITPIQIGALRYLPAAITLVIFCIITKRGKQLIIDLKEKYLHLIIASLILASFVLFQMFSVKLTEASASSFLLNVNPVITFILSIIILKERHKWWGGLGVLISAIGIFFIAIPLDEIGNLLSSEALLGNILAFLSGVAWAVYSIYLKKFLGEKDPITTTTWNLSFSAIILIISAIIEVIVRYATGNWFTTPPTYYHILTIAFMGVVPTAIAFTLWFAVLQRIHVQKASVFQFLIPIFATLFALAMGETIDLFFGIGGGLILVGLIITQFS